MLADSELLLPAGVASEIEDDQERDALLGVGLGRLMTATLKDIDERLRVAFSKPGGDPAKRILEPGYWYFVRFNDEGAPGYWRITEKGGLDGEHGDGYSHPEFGHVEALQRRDAWRHPRVWAEFDKRRRDAKRSREKFHDELHREFREKLDDRLRHEFEVQIAVPPSYKDKL